MTLVIIFLIIALVTMLIAGIVKKTRKIVVVSLFGLMMILMFGIGFFMSSGSM